MWFLVFTKRNKKNNLSTKKKKRYPPCSNKYILSDIYYVVCKWKIAFRGLFSSYILSNNVKNMLHFCTNNILDETNK